MPSPRGPKHRSNDRPESDAASGKVRLQRFLADAGVASRRECERMIEEGLVEVNGEVQDELPVFVDPARDRVSVNGRIVDRKAAKAERTYLALFKPDNTLTTTKDSGVEDESNARRTVLDLVDHPAKGRLIVVGRLGFHATGLVLLTNDGQLAQRLSHAKFGVTKTYRITIKGALHPEAMQSLRERFCPKPGQLPDYLVDELGQPIDPLQIVREGPGTTTIELVMRAGAGAGGGTGEGGLGASEEEFGREEALREVGLRRRTSQGPMGERGGDRGGDREAAPEINTGGGMLARMLTRMGNPVKRLERIAIGPLRLRFLSAGESRRLTKDEVQVLMEATGLAAPSGPRQITSYAQRPPSRGFEQRAEQPRPRPDRAPRDSAPSRAPREDSRPAFGPSRQNNRDRRPDERDRARDDRPRAPRGEMGQRGGENRDSRRNTRGPRSAGFGGGSGERGGDMSGGGRRGTGGSGGDRRTQGGPPRRNGRGPNGRSR